MENIFPDALIEDVRNAMATNPQATFAIVGLSAATYELLTLFHTSRQDSRLLGVFDEEIVEPHGVFSPLAALKDIHPTYIALAMDAGKEEAMDSIVELVAVKTRLLFAGRAQYEFHDPRFLKIKNSAHIPSLATGYPNTLIHIFECLQNAARLDLEGSVIEFGMFKGGTTQLIARFIKALDRNWRVIGFDTFSGFPPKRSLFDMYDHPDCEFHDVESVRRYLAGHKIEIVEGDIATTVSRLEGVPIVLAFVDTDNFTPARAAVEAIRDNVVVGGAIVFDHYTGRKRHRYTLGERIAARPLVGDKRYFNLHDTGVFLRQT